MTQALSAGSARRARHIPGGVVLICRNDRVVLHQAFGLRDPVSGAAMATDSIFRIYSMTKPIVSAAVMMLWEEGRFLLGDPVAKYIPEFASQKVAVATADGFELEPVKTCATTTSARGLAAPTAGPDLRIPRRRPGAPGLCRRAHPAARPDQRRSGGDVEHAAALLGSARRALGLQPLDRRAGPAGRDAWSGSTLGTFLKNRVTGPLGGMTDSGFHVAEADHGRLAQGFFAKDPDTGADVSLLDVSQPPTDSRSGGGGMVGSRDGLCAVHADDAERWHARRRCGCSAARRWS